MSNADTEHRVEVLLSTPDHGYGYPVKVDVETEEELKERIEDRFEVEAGEETTWVDDAQQEKMRTIKFHRDGEKKITAQYPLHHFQ